MRHKWEKHNSRWSTCFKCGCRKDKLSLTPVYTLNGQSHRDGAPECIPTAQWLETERIRKKEQRDKYKIKLPRNPRYL